MFFGVFWCFFWCFPGAFLVLFGAFLVLFGAFLVLFGAFLGEAGRCRLGENVVLSEKKRWKRAFKPLDSKFGRNKQAREKGHLDCFGSGIGSLVNQGPGLFFGVIVLFYRFLGQLPESYCNVK